ncbi:MAG: hypothetical protein IID36_11960 [Planctomycetes bacterium]|nr:hypothetical protein [Planctomycetota bacterium]
MHAWTATLLTLRTQRHMPAIWETTVAVRTPDIEKLAARSRWLLWLVVVVIALQFTPLLVGEGFGFNSMWIALAAMAVHLVMSVVLIVGVVLLLVAQGNHILMVIACGILMVAPCGNLLVLLLVNMSVTRTLRRAGLRVGLLGVDPKEVERIINPGLCSSCGYDLTGNTSGVCPECGKEL